MWHTLTATDTAKKISADITHGLSSAEAKTRLKTYGYNRLDEPRRISFFVRLINQMSDYMVIILLLAAAVSFFVSFFGGHTDYADPIMILAIVIINSAIGVIQENKAEQAISALKKMSQQTSTVLRDGKKIIINAEEIVPGDILFIESGDIVPADARLIKSITLKCNESSLTGESEDREKNAVSVLDSDTSIGDRCNMVWQSCVVTSGRGTAIVTATGMNTGTGKVAGMLKEEISPKTPLQQKLAQTGKTLGIAAALICGLIFAIGVIKKTNPLEMFMTAVSLAVAIIPEGLPAIITVILSLGVRRMAKHNAIIRKMSAVEALGSATVICSDKTGTLTGGKMTVTDYFGKKEEILKLCMLCSNNIGSTENALVQAAAESGISATCETDIKKMTEIPFDSSRKMMTVIYKTARGYMTVSKGAPEIILSKCSFSASNSIALASAKTMAQKGLRVIAVAKKDTADYPQNPEKNLEFIGLAGMKDPPREGVKKSVELCKNAGIKPVMITGDLPDTAKAIACETGIYSGGSIISGNEIDLMTDNELQSLVMSADVFARVTPEHKMKIVRAYQANGQTVAMTGDGVNDAPALKTANIGCAMGKCGTEVAKQSADVILTDDNFSTIVTAVKEGRGIYDNIRKTVHFLLSSNIGEMALMLICILVCGTSPLSAIQLLWINLVTDSLPAIALGMEKPEPDIMNRRPTNSKKSFFAGGLAGEIASEGIMIGLCAFIAFLIGNNVFLSFTLGSTMAFAVIGLSQIVHSLNMKSEKSVFSSAIFENKFMIFSFFLCALIQIAVIQIPSISDIFGIVPLDTAHWICVLGLSAVPLFVCEIQKLINRVSIHKNQ